MFILLKPFSGMRKLYKAILSVFNPTFYSQVKDFQRLIGQKQDTVRIREEEIEKCKIRVVNLENEVKEYSEKESSLKTKLQSVIKERSGRFISCHSFSLPIPLPDSIFSNI